MFELFKSKTTLTPQDAFKEFESKFNDLFADLDKRWFEQLTEARSFVPTVEDGKDTVTVTFKGPNTVVTVTADKATLPDVLTKMGIEIPSGLQPLVVKKKVTKKTSK